jgi:hypothetical protein
MWLLAHGKIEMVGISSFPAFYAPAGICVPAGAPLQSIEHSYRSTAGGSVCLSSLRSSGTFTAKVFFETKLIKYFKDV